MDWTIVEQYKKYYQCKCRRCSKYYISQFKPDGLAVISGNQITYKTFCKKCSKPRSGYVQ